MRWSRILWALLAVFILLLMIAPIASYCLGRDQDYSDRVGYIAPPLAPEASAAILRPLIPTRID
jgi:hypothetical protein